MPGNVADHGPSHDALGENLSGVEVLMISPLIRVYNYRAVKTPDAGPRRA
jgi:hypothetical protein